MNKLPAVSSFCTAGVQSTGAQGEPVSEERRVALKLTVTLSSFLLIAAAAVAINEEKKQKKKHTKSDPRNHVSQSLMWMELISS